MQNIEKENDSTFADLNYKEKQKNPIEKSASNRWDAIDFRTSFNVTFCDRIYAYLCFDPCKSQKRRRLERLIAKSV